MKQSPKTEACLKTRQLQQRSTSTFPFPVEGLSGSIAWRLLALALFYFHVVVIFDVIGEILRYKAWLLEHLEPKDVGKLLLLGCFFALTLRTCSRPLSGGFSCAWTKALPNITEGVYFSASSTTTLGYGDILLRFPWRHLGTLIAITGVLTFGCSTAFLFVVLQRVWEHF